MSKRLRYNVMFSFFNALITLLFPLITYPYVSRVLLPEGIGSYNIAFSIMSYFLLFANLGIPIYAIREIAKVRNDNDALRKSSTSIVILHAFSTIIIFSFYILYICLSPNTKEKFWVYFITGFHIISIFLNVEWFYQGREEYEAITIKNLIIKIASLVLIFVFVKDEGDLIIYAAIMILSVLGYGIFNFIHFLRIVKPSLKGVNLKALFKPVLQCFALYAASRLASGLDVIMIDGLLGDCADNVAGQYGVATKFVNVIIDLLLVVNTVMLPRLALQIENKEYDEARKLSQIIEEMIFMFVLPSTIGLVFVSKEIIDIFFGPLYTPAINTMMVMSGNAFLSVFTNFLGVSIIYAYGKDWYTTIAIFVGAVVNVLCNLFLIPKYLQLGAAIATIISNSVIFIIELIAALLWKYLKCFTLNNLKTIIAVIGMTGCLLLMHFYMHLNSNILSLIIKVLVAVIVYFVLILLMKHESIIFFVNELKSKFKRIKNK